MRVCCAKAFADTLCAVQVLLSVLIGPPLIAAFTYLLLHSGPRLVAYVWLFTLGLQLIALTVYPTVIAPLFNKFEPLPAGPLRCAVESASRLPCPTAAPSIALPGKIQG